MNDEEAHARARCFSEGKNPDALWPGTHSNHLHDGTLAGRPASFAWRAYTDPPSFRRADPPPLPVNDPHVRQADALEAIATHLARIRRCLEQPSLVVSGDSVRSAALADAVLRACERYNSLSPEEREAHDRAQRESWVRGMGPCEHGVPDWETCRECRAS